MVKCNFIIFIQIKNNNKSLNNQEPGIIQLEKFELRC